MRLLAALPLLATGCLGDSSDCRPHGQPSGGEIVRAVSFTSSAAGLMFPDGTFACTACEAVYGLAPGATHFTVMPLPGISSIWGNELAPGVDGDAYYIAYVPKTQGFALDHATETGTLLWSVPVGIDVAPGQLVAAPEGVYGYTHDGGGYTITTAYSAADGSTRWEKLGVYYPDGAGGLVQLDNIPNNGTTQSETVHSLDAALNEKWTKTISAYSVRVERPLTTASGTLVIWGSFSGALDLGDAQITAAGGTFVAALDRATGATLWTYTGAGTSSATVAGDVVVLWRPRLHTYRVTGYAFDRIDATGHASSTMLPITTQTLGGNVSLQVTGAPDGTLWLTVSVYSDDDTVDSYDVEVGSLRYSGPDQGYAFQLAP